MELYVGERERVCVVGDDPMREERRSRAGRRQSVESIKEDGRKQRTGGGTVSLRLIISALTAA